ncbi:hypothetical protein EVAR_11062_1 [Eumeta japonica]|uniref:Uncharacterized protein n=1 Tax=Eumeta variegata TaxID=151549 RepID=A0A4C1U405_EUMVA|nr:hypothetical protein EVAR_11062_1 [Eumeta japonica]
MVTGFQDFPGNGHGKIRGFCTVVPPTGTRRMHKQNWVSQISPARQTPKRSARHGYLFALSGAVSERMLDVLRPRELGPRGHVVFTIFPISQERATGKIPKSADRRPSESRKTMPRDYDAGARLGLCTLSEDWAFFENVQYILDLIGAHAQYGESFSLNLFRY